MSWTKRWIALTLTLLFVVSTTVVLGAPKQQTSQQQGPATSDSRSESRALTALNDSIQVDISCGTGPCTGSTISTSNQTRKMVVSSTGVIYALFWNSGGIWVAKSTNRGATFTAPKRVTTTAIQGEIAISGDGTLYVNWNTSAGTVYISKSTNGGTTWGAPVQIATGLPDALYGFGTQTVHMAVDGDYIYGVRQDGTKVYVSSNAGATWSEKNLSPSAQVFSDIHIDPISHNIYAFLDNPAVKWYYISDRGLTWSAEKSTSVSVNFSVGALTNNGTNKDFYIAGSNPELQRINLTTESVETKIVAASDGNTTRSLAADSCGNVISGNKTGSDLFLQYSTDSGATFSAAALVEAGASRSSASINYTNGDVMYLYEKAGHIYLTTYAGLLGGAGSCYALTISRTAVEFTRPGENQVITLKNTSTSSMAVTSITLTGTAFTKATTCKATIPAGGTCTITISGETEASELLTLVIGGITKKIPVSLGELAGDRPTATEVPPTRTPTLPGTATNTAIPTATSTPSNTPTFTPTMTPSPIPLLMKKGAVGASFVLGLLQNKTLVTWGMNREFQTNIPPCCGSGIDDIAVGTNFALALKGGKVYGWGANTLKQITFPATVNKDIVSIAAGGSHGLALSKKGLVYAWGDAGYKQTTIPKGLKDVIAIAAGKAHSLVIKRDGSVVAWGANESGQSKVPPAIASKPAKKVVQVTGGLDHSVALLDDATVLAWGGNAKGQSTVPANAKDMKQVSAGTQFTLAVRKDGTVFGWGSNEFNQLFIPEEFTDIFNANAGYSNTILGLRNGRIIVLGDQSNGVNASRTPTKTATPTP